MHTHMHAHACICICMHIRMRIRMHMYMHVTMHIHAHAYAYAYAVHAYNHAYPLPLGMFRTYLWAFCFPDLPSGAYQIYLFAVGPYLVIKEKLHRHVNKYNIWPPLRNDGCLPMRGWCRKGNVLIETKANMIPTIAKNATWATNIKARGWQREPSDLETEPLRESIGTVSIHEPIPNK